MSVGRALVAVSLVACISVAAAPGARAAEGGTGVSFRATLVPREVLFGDPLEARVDVVVERDRVDPRTVRVHVDLRPYDVAATRVTRRAEGALTRVAYRYRLLCLEKRCLPNGPERRVSFRPLRISWQGPDGRPETQTIFWPPLELGSRVDPRDLLEPTLRSEVARQPQVTWRVRPSAAVAALVAAAALLLVYPLLLSLRLLRRGWYAWRTSRLERLTPLERALELLRRAAQRGEDAPSRRALERLARELRGHELGDDARRLAWSRPHPDRGDMDSLRERVEEHR